MDKGLVAIAQQATTPTGLRREFSINLSQMGAWGVGEEGSDATGTASSLGETKNY